MICCPLTCSRGCDRISRHGFLPVGSGPQAWGEQGSRIPTHGQIGGPRPWPSPLCGTTKHEFMVRVLRNISDAQPRLAQPLWVPDTRPGWSSLWPIGRLVIHLIFASNHHFVCFRDYFWKKTLCHPQAGKTLSPSLNRGDMKNRMPLPHPIPAIKVDVEAEPDHRRQGTKLSMDA